MTLYKNGQIPSTALIKIASGTNGDGHWEHLLSPAQLAKHNALVTLAKNRHGRTLQITSGWNAYRPLGPQLLAKQKYGPDAAAVGFSSHGGTYNGVDAMAMDYGNWSWVYDGDKAAFYADCRAVGLTPGVIARETWHVICYDPWAAVPSGSITEPDLAEEPEEEGIDMSQIRYVHRAEPGYGTEWMIVGMEIPGGYQTTTDQTKAEGWGAVYGTDKGDSWKALTRKQYIALQSSAADLNRKWVAMQKDIHG